MRVGHILSGMEVGAPHQRKRVFILGYSSSKRPHRGSENCEGEQSEVLGERLESDEEVGATPRAGNPEFLVLGNSGTGGKRSCRGGSEDTPWLQDQEKSNTSGQGTTGRGQVQEQAMRREEVDKNRTNGGKVLAEQKPRRARWTQYFERS